MNKLIVCISVCAFAALVGCSKREPDVYESWKKITGQTLRDVWEDGAKFGYKSTWPESLPKFRTHDEMLIEAYRIKALQISEMNQILDKIANTNTPLNRARASVPFYP